MHGTNVKINDTLFSVL